MRAARTGMTLSDYLLAELRALAVRPTMQEWLSHSEAWEPVEVGQPPTVALAAERNRSAGVIVADASAIAELLLARPAAAEIRAVLAPHPELHVPEHFHVELLSVLRRYSIRGELSEHRAARHWRHWPICVR